MLKNIDPLLNPELLFALASMGHGDELAIVDVNFPAVTFARKLVRIDGATAPQVLEAVLTLFPLDDFVGNPATVMQAPGGSDQIPEPVRDFQMLLDRSENKKVNITMLDRFAFYERAQAAFAVVATGERRLCGNILLKKGVIRPA